MSAIRDRVLGAAVFVVFLCVLQRFSGALELDRQQVLSGEIWRIWTGHLVHTNMTHLTLNIAAALIIYFGFFTRVKLAVLLAYGFVFSTLISVALLCVCLGTIVAIICIVLWREKGLPERPQVEANT